MKYFIVSFGLSIFTFCGATRLEHFETGNSRSHSYNSHVTDTIEPQDTAFVNLNAYGSDFNYDMRYATPNNFLKSKVYDCAECYLRYATIKALLAANKEFGTLGYKITIYDCYRPLDIQKRMYKIVPDARYVANPKTGSIHNRGGAVDISLIDSTGAAVPMGTEFDHFGKEAHQDYTKLSPEIRANRKLLREIMEKNGFESIRTEWWHFNLKGSAQYGVSNFVWPCE